MYLSIATGPVVACPAPVLRDVNILLVVELGVRRVENAMNDPGFKVQQDSTRNVMLIICLYRGKEMWVWSWCVGVVL